MGKAKRSEAYYKQKYEGKWFEQSDRTHVVKIPHEYIAKIWIDNSKPGSMFDKWINVTGFGKQGEEWRLQSTATDDGWLSSLKPSKPVEQNYKDIIQNIFKSAEFIQLVTKTNGPII